ncbi:MAG: four helix bundle protein, partial [Deltaproteobacteria bacterium]|nr:four helix bundle protein [Deltaproteobacteria bacterium]
IGRRIGDQLLRSGTSVGANYEEAQGAESKKDFIHKLQVALKELRESYYWLKLLDRTKKYSINELDVLIDEASHSQAILSKAVVTSKGNSKQ